MTASARTTPRVRAELQAAQTSSRVLAAQYSLNAKTVLKWRKRSVTVDAPMRPKPRSTIAQRSPGGSTGKAGARLTVAEEAIIVEFRRRTLLPLDDVMGCLKDQIPKLTRSALHRCLARHGISRLPQDENTNSKRKPFKETKIGYVHIDSAQFRSAEDRTHMFLAIDRVSKFVYVEFHETAEMATGGAFLRNVIKAFPYQIHTVLTDNGVAFTKTHEPNGTACATCSIAPATNTASSTG